MLGCCDDDMLYKALGWLVLVECIDLCEWADDSCLKCCKWACYVGCDADEKNLGRGPRLLKNNCVWAANAWAEAP